MKLDGKSLSKHLSLTRLVGEGRNRTRAKGHGRYYYEPNFSEWQRFSQRARNKGIRSMYCRVSSKTSLLDDVRWRSNTLLCQPSENFSLRSSAQRLHNLVLWGPTSTFPRTSSSKAPSS